MTPAQLTAIKEVSAHGEHCLRGHGLNIHPITYRAMLRRGWIAEDVSTVYITGAGYAALDAKGFVHLNKDEAREIPAQKDGV